MKAEDLMIGDFVKHSESDIVGKVIMINTNPDGVHYHGKSITIQNGKVLYSGNESLFEPIPLTADILAKNGFKHEHNKNDGWVSLSKNPDWCIDAKIDETTCRLIVYNTTDVKNIHDGIFVNKLIHYVHELQHALKYSEIEKEIVL